ncbi:hypothetical protein ACZ91_10910 [Streptomyces regensis]|nr:hypothetical protein ACZ91_10910 [Streptomyces regensis]KOG59744.1 hypothetical protein ADK77_38785 [Streptomyces antibioticus]
MVMCVSSDSDNVPFRSKDGSALRDGAPATTAHVEVGTVTSRFTTTTTGAASIAEPKGALCPATTMGHIFVMAPPGSSGFACSRRLGALADGMKDCSCGCPRADCHRSSQ